MSFARPVTQCRRYATFLRASLVGKYLIKVGNKGKRTTTVYDILVFALQTLKKYHLCPDFHELFLFEEKPSPSVIHPFLQSFKML